MYIALTDYLRCPRCGPEHGLVLLGERIEARRVLDGVLGCANCREQYPVRGGWADLRRERGAGGERGAAARAPAGSGGDAEAALRLAALLGVTEGPGFVLVAGSGVGLAGGVARLVEGLEVVAVGDAPAEAVVEAGVSRIGARQTLPLADWSMRGVALTGDGGGIALEEAVRVVAPLGRLVVDEAGEETVLRLERAGFQVLAREGAQVVAVRR